MNLERFHSIVLAVLADVDGYNYPQRLAQLVDHLNNRASNPSTPSGEADAIINELRERLPTIASNSFSEATKAFLSEYGFGAMIGNELQSDIDSILLQNQITPSIAAKEIKELSDTLNTDVKHFRRIAESFGRFKFEIDRPDAGTCELGVLIPRAFVHNGLAEFGREATQLARFVRVFEEIATGTRTDPQIKTIASSDLSLFLIIDPQTALLIARAISNLIETYKTVLKIRDQINDLRKNIPDEVLKEPVDHANGIMATRIEKITEEILTKPDGTKVEKRTQELKIELQGALTNIAARIDRGFEFDVRAEPAKVEDGDAKGATQNQIDAVMKSIGELRPALSYQKVGQGEPILRLGTQMPPEPGETGAASSGEPS